MRNFQCKQVWETANVLNEFFASVFEKEGDGDLPFFPEQQYAEELSTINISSENVKKMLGQLKESK